MTVAFGFGAGRRVPQLFEAQRAEHEVAGVAAKVPHDAAAKRPPSRANSPAGNRDYKAVRGAGPSQRSHDNVSGTGACSVGRFIGSIAAIKPDVRFAHLANGAAPDQFNGATQPIFGAALVAHLGDDLVLERGQAHDSRFVHRAREGLFTIDVFAALHGRHRGDGMSVVGRGHQHGIDLLVHLVEHPAEILERLGLGMLLVNVARPLCVHVAQRHDVHARPGKVIEVTPSLAADADAGDIQLVVGLIAESEPRARQQEKAQCRLALKFEGSSRREKVVFMAAS